MYGGLRSRKIYSDGIMKEFKIKEKRATTRMGHLPVEGGGLNASYTTVDAIANICATAGNLGLRYGKTSYGHTPIGMMTMTTVLHCW